MANDAETSGQSRVLSQTPPSGDSVPHVDFVAISRSARNRQRSPSREHMSFLPRVSQRAPVGYNNDSIDPDNYPSSQHSILMVLLDCVARVINLGLIIFVLSMFPRFHEIRSDFTR